MEAASEKLQYPDKTTACSELGQNLKLEQNIVSTCIKY